MQTFKLKGYLKEWKMVVNNQPSQYVILGDLLNENSNETIGERNTDKDFLVFTIKENHSNIVPLKLSPIPVLVGDTIYQVGWSYMIKKLEPLSFAAIAKGYAGSSLHSNYVVQQNFAGLSGSPVLNRNNELVAIVSSWKFDFAANSWFNAPCSTDYLWEVLYSHWLQKSNKEKSIKTFQEFITHYQNLNGRKPEVSSYLYTELFFGDWLKSKGIKYGSMDYYNQWKENLLKTYGIAITADNYRKSLLIFDSWKEGYATGVLEINKLELMLSRERVSIPNLIDFCEFAQELSAIGKHDKAIAILQFADEKIQHMGQLYAFLGDAYLAKGDKALANENYLKCLKTYPEYPQAVDGLKKLE